MVCEMMIVECAGAERWRERERPKRCGVMCGARMKEREM